MSMTPEPLLIRMPNWLGDVVMATSALEALHRTGRYDITLLVREPWDQLFRADPRVRDVILCRDRGAGVLSTAAEIRRRRFKAVVDFTHSARSWILWKIAGIKRVFRERRPMAEHQALRYLSVCVPLAVDAPKIPWPPRIYTPDPQSSVLSPQSSALNPGAEILLFPSAAYGSAKQWSAPRYRALIDMLLARGWAVRLMGTSADRPFLESITSHNKSISLRAAPSLDIGLPLPDVMTRILHAQAVIACDSGAAHLAAALGQAVIVLFFSTDPAKTLPIGYAVRPVAAAVPCRPCFLRSCPIGYLCRDAVRPDDVIAQLNNLMDIPLKTRKETGNP